MKNSGNHQALDRIFAELESKIAQKQQDNELVEGVNWAK